jgi:hypothetical protein
MKLTNRQNLPEAFVRAVSNDPYSKGDADISVTGLLKPPKASELERQHADEIVEDVEDRVWSLFGQVTHLILERANMTAVAERRLSVEMEGWKISGGMDLYDVDGILTDYKTTSVWSLIYDGAEKWEQQLNLYAVLLRANGHKIERIQAVALLRDWSRSKAEQDPGYPQAAVVNVPLRLWAPEVAEKLFRERVILHKQARLTGQLPECNERDRWVRGEKWAVKKIGNKTAMRGGVFDTEAEAAAFKGFDNNLIIEHRPGVSVRCANYCAALPWCKQGQSYVDRAAGPTAETTEDKKAV